MRAALAALVVVVSCTPDAPASPLEERWAWEDCAPAGATELAGEVTVDEVEGPCVLAVQSTGIVLATDRVDPQSPIIQLSDGRFVAPTSGRDEIGIWSADGKTVEVFGRRGQGPGEIRTVSSVYLRNGSDSIYVSDPPGELEVFTSAAEWKRGILSGKVYQYEAAALLDSGDFIAARPHPGERRFTLVDGHTGEVRQSFGEVVEGTVTGDFPIAYNGGDTFWASAPGRYRMELWGVDGVRRATIERSVDWFPTVEPDRNKRQPYIATFALDASNILWVAVVVHTTDAPPPALGSEETDIVGNMDLVVEAFDAATGRLLSSERFDDPYSFFPPPLLRDNRAVRMRIDGDGVLHAEIVSYRLVRKPAGGS